MCRFHLRMPFAKRFRRCEVRLIVDNDDLVLDLLVDILQSIGCDPLADSPAALAAIEPASAAAGRPQRSR
jgi:hypothetical protein